MGTGEWVAEYPDRDVRGYHATRLIAPLASIERIVKASKLRASYEKQVFFNKDLGLPYAPEEGRLSKEALPQSVRRRRLRLHPVTPAATSPRWVWMWPRPETSTCGSPNTSTSTASALYI